MQEKNCKNTVNPIRIRKIHKNLFEVKFEETGEKFRGTFDEICQKIVKNSKVSIALVDFINKYCKVLSFQKFVELYRKSSGPFAIFESQKTEEVIFQYQNKIFICNKKDKNKFINAIEDAISNPEKSIAEFKQDDILKKKEKLPLPVSDPKYLPKEPKQYIFYGMQKTKQNNEKIKNNLEEKTTDKNNSYKSTCTISSNELKMLLEYSTKKFKK